jgi:hypothetical protein
MKKTPSLRKFDLRGNSIDDNGLMELWDGLKFNISITDLQYTSKHIYYSPENVANIEKQLKLNVGIRAILDIVEARENDDSNFKNIRK